MPFIKISKNWQIQGKTPHNVHLHIKEGFFNDTLTLYVDQDKVLEARAGLAGAHGSALFEIDGRTHELRWMWNMLIGNPSSIVIMLKGRILAQYGSDAAADDKHFQ